MRQDRVEPRIRRTGHGGVSARDGDGATLERLRVVRSTGDARISGGESKDPVFATPVLPRCHDRIHHNVHSSGPIVDKPPILELL